MLCEPKGRPVTASSRLGTDGTGYAPQYTDQGPGLVHAPPCGLSASPLYISSPNRPRSPKEIRRVQQPDIR